jgi:hypothetical protein
LCERDARPRQPRAHGDAELVLEARTDEGSEVEYRAARPVAALEEKAKHRLVDALLVLHGLGGEPHLPAGLPLAGVDVAREQTELNRIRLVHAELALPL